MELISKIENKYKGLSTEEVVKKLSQYGKNVIIRKKRINPLKILLAQFSSPVILILIAAALVSLFVNYFSHEESHVADAVLIFLIVFVSALIGFIQDYKAEKTIEKLQKMATPLAKVQRDGQKNEIQSNLLVPDDIIFLESGDIIPADCRVLEIHKLEIDESILTGESKSIKKAKDNDLCMNTFVTSGNAIAIVTQTGMNTRLGKVASTLQNIKEGKSVFEQELAELGIKLSFITLSITVLLAVVGYFKLGFYQALLVAISLAVAAIPEGLPAVVVLSLAVGARNMFKKNALIRKLSVVESVGAIDIICTDKTGTLTINEMSVTLLYTDDKEFLLKDLNTDSIKNESIKELLICGLLSNNTSININKEGLKKYLGEQTEIALWKIGEKFIGVTEFEKYIRLDETPFSSQRKMMSVVVEDKVIGQKFIYGKGAPEILLEKCSRILFEGNVLPLNDSRKQRILKEIEKLASSALRVLGFVFKEIEDGDDKEEDFVWIGLQAMIDPPRKEVKQALEDCNDAGIRVIMITGDNPLTAKAIWDEIGMHTTEVIEGNTMNRLSDDELEAKLNQGVNVFARTSPFHKLRLAEILQKTKRIGMTGDGVNDSLAIKKADVGISMGLKGTEVAKEASDIVLLDDNFSTIRDAIKEGRTIFDNIRKFVNYLLECNLAEVLVIFLVTLFSSLHEPVLFPIQILWINLLTDGIVALALGVDPSARDIMKKPPRGRDEAIIDKRLGWLIGLIGMSKTILLLAIFYFFLPSGIEKARSVLFTSFVLFEFVRIASIRYQEELGWFDNKWLIYALGASVIMQLIIIYSPLNVFFKISPLSFFEWGIILGGMLFAFLLAILITKLVVKYVKS